MKGINDNAEAVGHTTKPPTIAGPWPKGWAAAPVSEAEFLALPRPRERCHFSSLSRTTLVELLNRGDIKGVTLRRPGATRGKRLIVKKSLAEYLYRLANEEPARHAAAKKEAA